MGQLNDRQLCAWHKKGQPVSGKSDGGGLTFTLSQAQCESDTQRGSWVFRFRINGRAREVTLGNYPDVSIKKARQLAMAQRALVDQGVDVAERKRQEKVRNRQAGTVAALCASFVDGAIRSKYKHPERIERLFERDVIPVLGAIAAKDVKPLDVERVLRRISGDGRPTVANDALRLMRAMFRYGKKRGVLDFNPAADFEVEDAGGKEKGRARKLRRGEIVKLFEAIRKSTVSFGRDNELAVKLLLALGVRKMELLAATWPEFDLEQRIWCLPGTRSKTGKPIDIPLSLAAVEWLKELQVRACGRAYVFPNRRAAKRFEHMSPDTLNVALKNLRHGLDHFTVHDFRRTMRSELAALGIPSEIAERCLNHTIKGIEGTYNRHEYFEERKRAVAVWCDLLQTLDQGKDYKVVAIRAA